MISDASKEKNAKGPTGPRSTNSKKISSHGETQDEETPNGRIEGQGVRRIPRREIQQGGMSMEEPVPTPKARAAVALGNLFNDTRITNVMMLVLVLIGMGGAEHAQSALCSL